MKIRVLGSAAGGGFPQWNCGCRNCAAARAGDPALRPRTQESVAVSADGERWFLINASPEIRAQIESFSGLWPRQARHSPIGGVLLTNGDLDHCLGLLSLRESHPIVVFASESVRAGFTGGNVLYRTLERFPEQVTWRPLQLGREVPLDDRLGVTPVAAPGKLPLHLERLRTPSAEDSVGLVIRDETTGRRVAYFSGVAGPSPELSRALAGADVIFFDGTFWSSDELIAAGLGTRRAEEMAHWPIGGPSGSLAFLHGLPGRKILIHVNNTNPILREDSPERRLVTDAGVEVAQDGMEIDGMEIDPRAMTGVAPLWSADELVARLREEGVRRYHDQHPFHGLMHEGRLTREQLQAWTLNRYYYQTRIPIKDAIIVSKSEDPAFRRLWIRRIHDHDGEDPSTGGLALWLRLAEAVGLDREEVASCRRVLPGVRFACDAYVTLCRESPLVVAVASSLTEMFAPDLMSKRIAAWEQHYPWVGPEALAYFRGRVPRARRDGEEGLAFVVANATSRALQDACVAALVRKTEILWHLVDCVHAATVRAEGPGAGT